MRYDENIKNLVKKRIALMPSDISFSVGEFGDFSPQDLIGEIDQGSEIGNEFIEMQLEFIRQMPHLLKRVKNDYN